MMIGNFLSKRLILAAAAGVVSVAIGWANSGDSAKAFLYSDYLQYSAGGGVATTRFAVDAHPFYAASLQRIKQDITAPLNSWSARDSVVAVADNEFNIAEQWRNRALAAGWQTADSFAKTALLAATESGRRSAFLRNVEVDIQSGLGMRLGHVGLNFLGALRDTGKDAVAWQLRGYWGEDERSGVNAGLIYRRVLGDVLVGGNVFIDYETHNVADFYRLGLGGEFRSPWVDIFSNIYNGLSGDVELVDARQYVYTADGFDVEINAHSPDINWLVAAATYYTFEGKYGNPDDSGVRGGIKIKTPQYPFVIEAYYDDSDIDGGNWGGGIAYTYSLGKPWLSVQRTRTIRPQDFFFVPVSREYTQRLRQVEDLTRTLEATFVVNTVYADIEPNLRVTADSARTFISYLETTEPNILTTEYFARLTLRRAVGEVSVTRTDSISDISFDAATGQLRLAAAPSGAASDLTVSFLAADSQQTLMLTYVLATERRALQPISAVLAGAAAGKDSADNPLSVRANFGAAVTVANIVSSEGILPHFYTQIAGDLQITNTSSITSGPSVAIILPAAQQLGNTLSIVVQIRDTELPVGSTLAATPDILLTLYVLITDLIVSPLQISLISQFGDNLGAINTPYSATEGNADNIAVTIAVSGGSGDSANYLYTKLGGADELLLSDGVITFSSALVAVGDYNIILEITDSATNQRESITVYFSVSQITPLAAGFVGVADNSADNPLAVAANFDSATAVATVSASGGVAPILINQESGDLIFLSDGGSIVVPEGRAQDDVLSVVLRVSDGNADITPDILLTLYVRITNLIVQALPVSLTPMDGSGAILEGDGTSSDAPYVVEEENTDNISVTIAPRDDGNYVYTKTGGSDSLEINDGVITFLPDTTPSAGIHNIVVQVRDSDTDETSDITVYFRVNPPVVAPSLRLSSSLDGNGTSGSPYSFVEGGGNIAVTVMASDDSVNYVYTKTGGADSLDINNGIITFSSAPAAGDYMIVVQGSDSVAELTLEITVYFRVRVPGSTSPLQVSQSSSLDGDGTSGSPYVADGGNIAVTIMTSGGSGDSANYVYTKTSGAALQINDSSGIITFINSSPPGGDYTIVVQVSDGVAGLTSSITVYFRVGFPPLQISSSSALAGRGISADPYSLLAASTGNAVTVMASGGSGDSANYTYSMVSGSSELSYSNRVITFNSAPTEGNYMMVVQVIDNVAGLTSSITVHIRALSQDSFSGIVEELYFDMETSGALAATITPAQLPPAYFSRITVRPADPSSTNTYTYTKVDTGSADELDIITSNDAAHAGTDNHVKGAALIYFTDGAVPATGQYVIIISIVASNDAGNFELVTVTLNLTNNATAPVNFANLANYRPTAVAADNVNMSTPFAGDINAAASIIGDTASYTFATAAVGTSEFLSVNNNQIAFSTDYLINGEHSITIRTTATRNSVPTGLVAPFVDRVYSVNLDLHDRFCLRVYREPTHEGRARMFLSTPVETENAGGTFDPSTSRVLVNLRQDMDVLIATMRTENIGGQNRLSDFFHFYVWIPTLNVFLRPDAEINDRPGGNTGDPDKYPGFQYVDQYYPTISSSQTLFPGALKRNSNGNRKDPELFDIGAIVGLGRVDRVDGENNAHPRYGSLPRGNDFSMLRAVQRYSSSGGGTVTDELAATPATDEVSHLYRIYAHNGGWFFAQGEGPDYETSCERLADDEFFINSSGNRTTNRSQAAFYYNDICTDAEGNSNGGQCSGDEEYHGTN